MIRTMAETFFRKKDGVVGCVFAAALLLAQFTGAINAGAVSVSMDGNAQQYRGVAFTVDLALDAVTDLFGTAVDLAYDAEFLDLVDSDTGTPGLQPQVVEGTLLNNDGADPSHMRYALEDGKPGNLILGITRSGDVSGVDAVSERRIASISFFPKKLGTTTIALRNQGLRDSTNGDIAVDAWNDLTINILLPPFGDFDHNGVVDLRDLILGLKSMTSTILPGTHADVDADGDGRLSMGDLVYVLRFLADM